VNRTAIAAALAALIITSSSAASAVVTKTWVVDSYKEFDDGDADSAVITSLGEVRPGWSTARSEIPVDGVWSAVQAGDGSILLGTDDSGAIYRARGGTIDKLATIPDVIAVVSLTAGKGNKVYAGTMPEGLVYEVDAKTGKTRKLAALDGAETVWSLTTDATAGKLYAGTGPDGKLFEVDTGSGKARVVFESDDKRVLAVARSSDGAIWLGTSDKAQVFRYDPKKKTTRAMADFAGNEITDLAPYNGGVLVIANDFDEPSTSGFKTKAAIDKAKKKDDPGVEGKKPATGSKPGADKSESSSAKVPRKGGRKGKGTLFRVHGDSRIEQLHALTQTYFTSLAVTETGRIFAAAGDKGRVYMIDTDRAISTAFDVEERIVAELIYDRKDGLSFATTDAAAFYRTSGAAKKSTYTSKVLDAKAPARFGRIAWRGDGKLRIETRSGNTAKPGKGWSSWATPRSVSRGAAANAGGKVVSPTGRYVQFRVRFDQQDAILRSATLYYLPQNRATQLESVTVDTDGAKTGVTTKTGATKPRSPILEVKWKVDNPDGDQTTYKLAVRREGEVLWRDINSGKKPITSTKFEWNTETFPDGWYRLRVTASDRGANSADRSMESHKTSALFRVDNEKPTIDGISVRYPNASARAVDSLSIISEMAYSVDDGPWKIGATRDGLFDDAAEMLRIELPRDLSPGVHTLSIRVADDAGNIGSASVTFRVK
jgi:hypothetical protein